MIPDGTESPKDAPLVPGTADTDTLLNSIQGNILKGHGRPFTRLILFWFDDATVAADCRGLISAAAGAGYISTAYEQWSHARANAAGGEPQYFFSLGISLSGMRRCGYLNNADLPLQGAEGAGGFTHSMRKTFPSLEDLPPGDPDWDDAYFRDDGPHGVWLLAHDNPHGELDTKSDELLLFLKNHGAHSQLNQTAPPAIEKGMKWMDTLGQTREPFGFRDGISDPPFFADDYDKDGADLFTSKWVNLARDQVLIHDETGQHPEHDGGSFLVLRKLEQNVEAFRQWEKDTGISGALLVGRERDGTPLQLLTAAKPALNNFSFDKLDAQCPFHAHIRKASPRINGTDVDSKQVELHQRSTLFVRRGVVYGIEKLPPPKTLPPDQAATYLGQDGQPITGGVGLLFMAYMSSIKRQFLEVQKNWFGCPGFPTAEAHLGDPLLRPHAMLRGDSPHEWRWSQRAGSFPLKDFVKTKGGAYFYVPPISWLKNPPVPRG